MPARTQLDIPITIPTGAARKLIMLWGSDGGEFPTAVTFDPAGVAFPMTPIDGASNEIGDLRVAAYYLDAPPTGATVVRITTATAVWSVASLKVYRNARAGAPQADSIAEEGTAISALLDDVFLADAFSETADLILASGLSDGDLTPFTGQTMGADDVVNGSFLATTSDRRHGNNGTVGHGWSAASSADLLLSIVNILFNSGQAAPMTAVELSQWDFDEGGTNFSDSHERTNASVVTGTASGGHSPLLADGGSSISIQGTNIEAAHHVDHQVSSWSLEVYKQRRSNPGAGANMAVISKDSILPQPGGIQLEIEDDGAIDWYIRDATGLLGTSIHVTAADGQGDDVLDEASVFHLTYDDVTKTAAIYVDKVLLVQKTDPNFAGLQNNSSVWSFGCRSGFAGAQFDGVLDRVTFWSGALTQAEINGRPDAVTITDPEAPGDISMEDIPLGVLAASSVTDVDPADFATGLGAGNRGLTQITDPANRMTFINDDTPTAMIRITLPAAPASTTNESASAEIREDAGPPSNTFNVTWTRQGQAGPGGYTPFPFNTDPSPTVSHSGVTNRPGFSATNPRSASIIDPMSGIEIFRVGGNNGANIMINGTSDSGLNFPRRLRNENGGSYQKVWNADGSLLMIDRRFSVDGDAGSAASSYLIDASGTHGASVPWRIVRASSSTGLGDTGTQWWIWDPLNPLRAYIIRDSGQVDEWWPIGGSGHPTGDIDTIRGAVSGFSGFTSGAGRHHLQTSRDGIWYISQCRQSSSSRWGGMRINLQTGALGPFVMGPTFGYTGSNLDHPDRACRGTSADGRYSGFSPDGGRHQFFDFVTGAFESDTANISDADLSHNEYFDLNGVQYVIGSSTASPHIWNIVNGTKRIVASAIPNNNPAHYCTRHMFADTFENHGAAGGGTSGLRYAMIVRSNTPAGIWGIRLGPNDNNVTRYICHHRCVRSSNANECHAQMSLDSRKVVFNSNWEVPGGADSDVHPYVALIPDAWFSPNNNGS